MKIDDPLFTAWAAQFFLDGRAEVLMVARGGSGLVWLHRKQFWRLPSGSLRYGEGADETLRREVVEEFG
jgi:8-oxo-dGTP pyrophosphatase MutT (NUDIX family)